MNYITRSLFCLGLGVFAAACGGSDESVGEDAQSVVSNALPLRGVNLAGAEFAVDPYGNGSLPGTHGVNYMYPDAQYATGYSSPDYFLGKGMTTFRLPFRWERLQPTRKAAFDTAELSRLTTTVGHLTAKGATVLIDPHNYARYGTNVIGSAAVPNADFADLWTRLANTFKGNSKVVFDLMNEPHDMPTEQWASAANAAIAAIRATGATNLILVPGNGWDGAGAWTANWYGTPNATAMLSITDPGNNYAFEVHQYLDADSSGTNQVCPSATAGATAMQVFTTWLRQNGKRGFLGEFGASNSATCLAGINGMLGHIEQNADVYLGWTYWAGGPWWGQNWMMVEPSGGADVAQMTTLIPHLAAVSVPTTPAPSCTDGIKNGTETGVDCGGSCAACPSTPPSSCTATSYDAANMVKSLGSAMTGGWNLWSNGYVAQTHTFAAGQTTITVSAGGSQAANVWPHMVVSIDGTPIGNTSITGAAFANYAFTYNATAGSHEIRVTFDNDFASTTEDRNLYIAKVSVGCSSTTTTPPPATPQPSCTDGIKNGTETGVDCGGSCAACPSAPPATCNAKSYASSAVYHSIGAATTDGWNIYSNGYASTNHAFTAGSTTITVRAKGSPMGNVWPHMLVSVGGTVIGSASVQSASYTAYPFTFTAAAGTKEIRVTFDNDAASTTEDRNLYLDTIAVSCGGAPTQITTTAPACVPTTCAAAAKNCGSISDGCGGTLTCGTCGGSQTCGGAGVANVCGSAPVVTQPTPSTGTYRIMPLGDSITLGVNGGYRNGLWTRLTNAGKSIDFVGSQVDQYAKAPDHDHEGHPGFTIGNIAASATSWVSSTSPDYVLLMIGTNDVAWWCAQTGAQVADQNALLIDQILAAMPNTWVVVGSIAPLTSSIIQPNNVDRAQLGKDYNAALQQRVQTRISAGKKVRWADVNAVLTTADLYDGVHPTEAAADKVAQVWYNALQPIMP